VVSTAFNAVLRAEGGSLPVWLILNSLRHGRWSTQLDLARSLGIEGPTMTRHLDNLEQSGFVTRRRSESDRRAVHVELTEAGSAAYDRMLGAVIAFNKAPADRVEPGRPEAAPSDAARRRWRVASATRRLADRDFACSPHVSLG
jgi:MarR family transcriptional regulator for hemolysin